ncbi:MAG: DUF4386 domain-containing protein [Cyclobacteriaceae bacterium]|nr:DUF4386 domain-containing protein [Cyclobacteriaceae bacterium]
MTTPNNTSRIAGLIYLGVVLTGLFSLMYVPARLIDYHNPALTFQNVKSAEALFRWGIVIGLMCYGLFLFLPLVLYKLFKPVHKPMAQIMVLLAAISVPMYFINAQNQFTALSVITNPAFFQAAIEQLPAQFLFYINQYNDGMRLIHIFSGLWLFPFGYLVFKSDLLPKTLGVLLMVGCFGYLLNFVGRTLISNYSELGISSYLILPASLGEIGICLWLLIVGARAKKPSHGTVGRL